jgi:hypothetical protein
VTGWVLAWVACRGGEAPVGVEGLPAPRHAGEWSALVAAAERGDLQTARVLARDLTIAPVPEDHESAAALGAALGYLQVADDPADLPDVVGRARAACVACHEAHGVVVPID